MSRYSASQKARMAAYGVATVALVSSVALGVSIAHAGTESFSGPVGNTAPSTYWQLQTGQTCVENSIRGAVGTLTGREMSVDSLVARASVLDGNKDVVGTGTDPHTLPMLVQSLRVGVEATPMTGPIGATVGTVEALRGVLTRGGVPIVVVDGPSLWRIEGLNIVADAPRMLHAIVVDAVDNAAHTVTITDSAVPNGALISLPEAAFMSAWQAGGSWALDTHRV